MTEIAARPVNFAGHQACEDCHTDVLEKKKSGKHVHVNCEACHGPLAKHVDDPGSVTTRQTRHRGAVRPLSRGEHRQAEGIPASRFRGPLSGCPAIPATSRTARRSSTEKTDAKAGG
jgi:hypothetical protein